MNPACVVKGNPFDPERGRYVVAARDIAAGTYMHHSINNTWIW